MSPLLDHIETMRKALKEGEHAARRTQYRLTAKLIGLLAGGIVTTAATARLIELDYQWWLITAGVVVVVVWGRAASRAASEVDEARDMRDSIAHAVECLPDEELLDFLNAFMGGPPSSVVVDDNPDAASAPKP